MARQVYCIVLSNSNRTLPFCQRPLFVPHFKTWLFFSIHN